MTQSYPHTQNTERRKTLYRTPYSTLQNAARHSRKRTPPLKSCRGLKRPSYRGSTKLPPAPPMAPLAFELLAFDDDELLLLAFDELELAFVESGTIDEWALEELQKVDAEYCYQL